MKLNDETGMHEDVLVLVIHFDKIKSEDTAQATLEMVEDLGENTGRLDLGNTLRQFSISKTYRFPDAVTLDLPVGFDNSAEGVKDRHRLQDFLNNLVGRRMLTSTIIGVDVTLGNPLLHAKSNPVPAELAAFEERGLKYLQGFSKGDSLQGIAARTKIKQVAEMKETNPLRYRIILETNYRAENPGSRDQDGESAPTSSPSV